MTDNCVGCGVAQPLDEAKFGYWNGSDVICHSRLPPLPPSLSFPWRFESLSYVCEPVFCGDIWKNYSDPEFAYPSPLPLARSPYLHGRWGILILLLLLTLGNGTTQKQFPNFLSNSFLVNFLVLVPCSRMLLYSWLKCPLPESKLKFNFPIMKRDPDDALWGHVGVRDSTLGRPLWLDPVSWKNF